MLYHNGFCSRFGAMFARILRFTFIILFCAIIRPLYAQPILPAIGGTYEKGIVILTWSCQYEGLKSIAVQRSSDSVHNFATIGYVKNLQKGPQAFIDGHPAPGQNWYQLYIVFNSDLTWNSNRIKLLIDSASLLQQNRVLPPNDSLQNIIVTNGKKQVINASETRSVNEFKKRNKHVIVVNIDTSGKPVSKIPNASLGNMITSGDSASSKTESKKPEIISISMGSDVKNTYTDAYIKSIYVFTNPLTGHVNMELPDVAHHKYSIRFFDDKDRKVLDVQRLPTSPIILDKRNFQQKGIYKFILRRDNSEFDTGYITIY